MKNLGVFSEIAQSSKPTTIAQLTAYTFREFIL